MSDKVYPMTAIRFNQKGDGIQYGAAEKIN